MPWTPRGECWSDCPRAGLAGLGRRVRGLASALRRRRSRGRR
jgi:hypothetical protein